jgi:glycosyltransferase involved in cell wall biosynthesis
MNKSIGGSIFVRNAVEWDYCVKEAVLSLVPFCDEVVVGDASSTDGTLDILKELEAQHSNVRVVEGLDWNCAPDNKRLSILANEVKNKLNTDWHFMLQADEVVHEDSIPAIKELANNQRNISGAFVRRWNLWDNFDQYVKLTSRCRPCGDCIIRLSERRWDAVGDAEGLLCKELNKDMSDKIFIFHYGFLRNNMVNKVLDTLSWFFENGGPDPLYVQMKENGGEFKSEMVIPKTELANLPMPHPEVMAQWIADRRNREIRR